MSSYDFVIVVVIIIAEVTERVTGACGVASAVPTSQMGTLKLGHYRARLKGRSS